MTDSDGFADLQSKRRRYVESARENDFEEGLRSLLAELYPDNAHFIYELLQNAEDAQATVVKFDLSDHALTVSHDGARAFTLADIESITGIGKSTKKDDETQIGKFGVGFKAVFAYTTRPEISSGEFSFAISDLFVPESVNSEVLEGFTTFVFPFDRPEKPARAARVEVERGLRELNEKTLLFLNNIREIAYLLPDGDVGFVKRVDVDDLTIRVEASQGEELVESTWLRLVGPASASHRGQNPLTVAAAFRLEPKGTGKTRSGGKPDAASEVPLGIVPLSAGDVSIYFPAAKETSGLKFHIHAPFASTVARDSVRDTVGNDQLVADIGSLIVENLEGLRDRGLIDDGLLAALPNNDDDLKPIYGQIRNAVVDAFNDEPLTPVRGGGVYRRARSLVSSPSEFRAALESGDLRYLLELGGTVLEDDPRWVLDRDGRAGQFLRDLRTLRFGWGELNSALWMLDDPYGSSDALDEVNRQWCAWLESKGDEKLLNFYELLGQGEDELWVDLKAIPLIRLRATGGSKYVKGPETHLPETPSDNVKSRVPVELAYFDGEEATKRSNNLRSFYSAAGVKRWDERAKVDRRLAAYRNRAFPKLEECAPSPKHVGDMRAFVQYGLAHSLDAPSMFSNVNFVLVVKQDDRLAWAKPRSLFIDQPFRATGLSALYANDPGKYSLPGFYLEIEGIDDFLVSLDAISDIRIVRADVFQNPELKSEWWSRGRSSSYTETVDWRIERLRDIVATGDPVLLQTLWETVIDAKGAKASAIYQRNRSAGQHVFNSQLHQQLTTTAWVLDRDGRMRLPREVTLDDIRDGWRRPTKESLVHKLQFGSEAAAKEAQASAKEFLEIRKSYHAEQLGIDSKIADLLKEAEADGIDVEAVIREKMSLKRSHEAFPDDPSENPGRRGAFAGSDAGSAPVHETEIRARSVVVGRGQASEEARAYLREHYTNAAGDMYCQACHDILPFKVKGNWYFEAIQFVGSRNRLHRQNALALCPLCAAKYRYARETSDKTLLESLSAVTVAVGQGSVELSVLLDGQIVRLRLTGKHAIDLQSAMAVAGDERQPG